MKYEPLIDKKHELNPGDEIHTGLYVFDANDVESAYNFYITYCKNATRTRFHDEQPEHWKMWLKHIEDSGVNRLSFDEWLLRYSFKDVI